MPADRLSGLGKPAPAEGKKLFVRRIDHWQIRYEPMHHSSPGQIERTKPPASAEPKAPPSLWQELADGSAGPVVRVVVSVALAALFAGGGLLLSYALAGIVPDWASKWGGGFSPSDELVAAVLILMCFPYVGSLIWVWSRTSASRRPHHEFWRAGVFTFVIVLTTIVLAVLIDSIRLFHGSFDVLFGSVMCFAAAGVILLWLRAARRFARGKPLRDPADGAMDIRCPACGYRMVGLHQSRCPECGTIYTLDELLARQGFVIDTRSAPAASDASPPRPPAANESLPLERRAAP